MDASRAVALTEYLDETGNKGFLDYAEIDKEAPIFTVSSNMYIEPHFHSLVGSNSTPELVVNLSLGHIGKTSWNSIAVLHDLREGRDLVKTSIQYVLVDRGTRKPKLLPNWWIQKYKEAVAEKERLVVKPLEKPDKCLEFDMKVTWSDIDNRKHTNYMSYSRFCLDAAMEATDKRYYSMFRDDILKYYMKGAEFRYTGESFANDQLRVYTWENVENPWKIHFDIHKINYSSIFQSSIEYFNIL